MPLPWIFFRSAALGLFAAALLVGFAATALFMGRHLSLEAWRILVVLALIVLTVSSTILIPRVLIPNVASPRPEFLSGDLQDE